MLPEHMTAVLLTGHGGLDKLEYRTDVAVPRPDRGEVLIEVAAAGINNTDINTRIGWYSKAIDSDTSSGGASGFESVDDDDASWSGTTLKFPRIQARTCVGASSRSVTASPPTASANGSSCAPCCAATSTTARTNAGRSAANATAASRSTRWLRPGKPSRSTPSGAMPNSRRYRAPTPPPRTCCTAPRSVPNAC